MPQPSLPRLVVLIGCSALVFWVVHVVVLQIGLGAFENAIPKSASYPDLLAEFHQHLSRGAAALAILLAGAACWGLFPWFRR